ncbi:MAG: DUF1015 domain-containing protein [Gemmatimonadota bacterium]|nr:MAG: DUF1015 domain-containing protein [Gemmatimonadota bacterium]
MGRLEGEGSGELTAVKVAPFRALRFQASRVGDLGSVWAPPYDVIDSQSARELRAGSPYNIVRITNPEGEGAERYLGAARLLRSWIAEGALARDPSPAFYVHRHNFNVKGDAHSRLGLWTLLRLAGFDERVVLPHEQTMKGPKEDRLALMRACRAHLSPIFFICSDADGQISTLLRSLTAKEPVERTGFPPGEQHEIWQVVEPGDQEELAALLSGQTFLIADGHHRYETALAYRDELSAAWTSREKSTIDYVLAYVVAENDPGLLLLPTHRTIAGEPLNWAAAALKASARFDIVRLDEESLDRARRELESEAGRPAFVLMAREQGGGWLMRLRGAGAGAVDTVSSVAFHVAFLSDCAGLSSADQLERISYVKDPEAALQAVRSGAAQAAALLAPPEVGQVRAAVISGERLPPKTTYFWPKVPTGIAMHAIELPESVDAGRVPSGKV